MDLDFSGLWTWTVPLWALFLLILFLVGVLSAPVILEGIGSTVLASTPARAAVAAVSAAAVAGAAGASASSAGGASRRVSFGPNQIREFRASNVIRPNLTSPQ
jgi:type IV secretory pathway TrbL component